MTAVAAAPVCPLTARPRPGGPLADEVLLGMAVEVLEQTNPRYWHVRTFYGYEGFVPARCLLSGGAAAAWQALPKCTVRASFCDVMARPSLQSRAVATLPRGALAAPEGEPEGDWQRVSLPHGRGGYIRSDHLGPYHTAPAAGGAALREGLANAALSYLGAPYRWGGKTPLGIDCSGLTSMAYLLNGVAIYRDARIQPGFPIHEIPFDRLEKGDLIFFPGHVAMYLGGGRYIHATAHPGSDGVVLNSLDPAAPDYRPDLPERIIACGSVF